MALFRSSRSEEVVYESTVDSCTCPAFQHRGHCAHVEQLQRWAEWGMKAPEGILDPPPEQGSWKKETPDGP